MKSHHHLHNEDNVCTSRRKDKSAFFLFDGHGEDAYRLTHTLVPRGLMPKFVQNRSVQDSITEFDLTLQDKMRFGGCTATGFVAHHRDRVIEVVNLGDSRTMVCSSRGEALFITSDHSPEKPSERNRIESLGGFVRDKRVNGGLAISRCIGDFELKVPTPYINSIADVHLFFVDEPVFVVVMSDGVWTGNAFETVVGEMLRTIASIDDVSPVTLRAAAASLVSRFGNGIDDCTIGIAHVE